MTTRWAVYFAPATDSAWWRFGRDWLGRDDRSADVHGPVPHGLPHEAHRAWTAAPRRYGFHATLKAPMRLREGITDAQCLHRVEALAGTLSPVRLTPLTLSDHEGFVALVPGQADSLRAIADIEAACVQQLDDLRAPLSDAEVQKRLASGLDEHGEALLRRWGYPRVLDRFRLHFTLTEPLDAQSRTRAIDALTGTVQHLNQIEPLWLDRLCLFVEPAPGQPLLRRADVMLAASAR